jgi:hypothetical protein
MKAAPKSWRDVLPGHPAADLFPMMSIDELKALGEDIKKHGLKNPVALWAAGDNEQKDRLAETFGLECFGLSYVATVGRFSDGRLAEIFLTNHKAGSHADACARDAAIVCSLALQHGVPLETIRHALLRDSQGRPSTPIGVAIDLIAEMKP